MKTIKWYLAWLHDDLERYYFWEEVCRYQNPNSKTYNEDLNLYGIKIGNN